MKRLVTVVAGWLTGRSTDAAHFIATLQRSISWLLASGPPSTLTLLQLLPSFTLQRAS